MRNNALYLFMGVKIMAIMHERIQQLRAQRDLTLSQVADYLGVTEATAQRYETGKGIKNIPYDAIEKYANLFNCAPQYIMGWEREECLTEDIIKDNDIIANIIVRLRMDKDFLSIVDLLSTLDNEKLISVKQMLKAFSK